MKQEKNESHLSITPHFRWSLLILLLILFSSVTAPTDPADYPTPADRILSLEKLEIKTKNWKERNKTVAYVLEYSGPFAVVVVRSTSFCFLLLITLCLKRHGSYPCKKHFSWLLFQCLLNSLLFSLLNGLVFRKIHFCHFLVFLALLPQ